MQLKHLQNLLEPSVSGASKISALAFSPDNMRLAICHERTIWMFDEQGEKRDKFATKPIDSKYGKKSYVVTSLAFSPDSNRLAIGQSDNIVFVYKIGTEWGDKKEKVSTGRIISIKSTHFFGSSKIIFTNYHSPFIKDRWHSNGNFFL